MKRRTLKQVRHQAQQAAQSRPRRKSRRAGDSEGADHHHHVYVVLLDPAVAELPTVRRENPDRRPDLPCVYVGMTGLTPEERFANHRNGVKAAWVVKEHGVRLMPELYAHFNPMPYEAAAEMERDLAEDLRREGYTVAGGH